MISTDYSKFRVMSYKLLVILISVSQSLYLVVYRYDIMKNKQCLITFGSLPPLFWAGPFVFHNTDTLTVHH